MRFALVLIVSLAPLAMQPAAQAMTPQERREYLERLQKILPASEPWRQWLEKSGELPPDFDSLPRRNQLPDPMLDSSNGQHVRTAEEWRQRRSEIQKLFEQYFIGTLPPRPTNLRAVPLGETRDYRVTVKRVRLEFGPDYRGKIGVELFTPDGKGPFPVLLGPVWIRPWAQIAVRRGYLCAIYNGSDSSDDADALAAVYPDYDFSLIARRAWAGMRTLDYLQQLPEADMRYVGITGHSRDGKQALIEAAFDDRISAVIASSTGVGGMLPYRLAGERGFGEGIESITRVFPTWFHPRLRFFAGREDRLPVDGNLLVALVAPRSCLLASALNDWVDDVWGIEQSYLSALPVYRLLGQPQRLGLRWRFNLHSTYARDIEDYLDWFDIQFGRSERVWNSELLYGFDFDRWREKAGESLNLAAYPPQTLDSLEPKPGEGRSAMEAWTQKAAEIRKQVQWILGERPPRVAAFRAPVAQRPRRAAAGAMRPTVLDDIPGIVMRDGASFGWRKPESELAAVRGLAFGDNLRGDLYYPAAAAPSGRLPVVIWLHGYSYATGYEWSYRTDLSPILGLVKQGYAVFAFDMQGFGTRIFEAEHFYDRYPRWSRFGKMVDDVRAAIDALQDEEPVEPSRVYVLGFSVGATVGLHSAALDDRIKGVVSICGFTPMRLDTAARGVGEVAEFGQNHGFLPRLGFFAGQEARIPYDYHELLALIAPRPVIVVQPELDRDAHVADVRLAVDKARQIYGLYGAANRLHLEVPWDYNRLPEKMQEQVIEEMTKTLR